MQCGLIKRQAGRLSKNLQPALKPNGKERKPFGTHNGKQSACRFHFTEHFQTTQAFILGCADMSDLLYMTGATLDECWPLIRNYHYSKRMPAATKHGFSWREEGGLFGDSGLPQAVALYGQPVNRNWPQDALELTRLVRKDDFTNHLSEFVAWTLRWLKANTNCSFALSYADTGQNHHGGIYQATNWKYVKLSKGDGGCFLDGQGNFIHGRTAYLMFGTRSIEIVLKKNPTWTIADDYEKHVYIFPLRKRLNPLLKQFGWKIKPYPKPDYATCPVDEPVPSGVSAAQPRKVAPKIAPNPDKDQGLLI